MSIDFRVIWFSFYCLCRTSLSHFPLYGLLTPIKNIVYCLPKIDLLHKKQTDLLPLLLRIMKRTEGCFYFIYEVASPGGPVKKLIQDTSPIRSCPIKFPLPVARAITSARVHVGGRQGFRSLEAKGNILICVNVHFFP